MFSIPTFRPNGFKSNLIPFSALFEGDAAGDDYLSQTFSTGSNGQKWTVSWWGTRGQLGATGTILSPFGGASEALLYFQADDTLKMYGNAGSAGYFNYVTTQKFRDPTAWMHLTFICDTTLAIAADRFQVWFNGVRITAFSSSIMSAQNSDTDYFGSTAHWIGRYPRSNNHRFSGYMSAIHGIDGQALDSTSFGKFDKNGRWQPIKVSGLTYGTNGFALQFLEDNGGVVSLGNDLGKDTSGNGNHWVMTASGVTQIANDTGSENAATLNPLNKNPNTTLSNGNRTSSSGGGTTPVAGTLAFDIATATFEWEMLVDSGTFCMPGILPVTHESPITNVNPAEQRVYYGNTGQTFIGTSNAVYGDPFTTGDIIKVRIDTGSVTFFKNGVSQGVAWSGLTGMWTPYTNHAGASQSTYDFGTNGFEPSTGYLKLTSANFPKIKDAKLSDHFATRLHVGNVPGQSIDTGFPTHWAWMKARSSAFAHRMLDAVRGDNQELFTNQTNAGFFSTDSLSFTGTGVDLGTDPGSGVNEDGVTYVGWYASLPNLVTSGWAGSPTITPSSERYNAVLGMAIVAYTGNGVAGATIPHSGGKKPFMWIVKRLNGADDWPVGHQGIPITDHLNLNIAAAATNPANARWNDTEPTETLISLGSDASVNGNTNTYIAYIFYETDFCKPIQFEGNASVDGPFVNMGISPVWSMIKPADVAGTAWKIQDAVRNPYNPLNLALSAQSSAAEVTETGKQDYTATGIKLRVANADVNYASTQIGVAFGEPTAASNLPPATSR